MQRHILTPWLFQNYLIYSPSVHGQLILSSTSVRRHWYIHISITWTSHISYLHSKRVNHGVANLVNLPVYSLLSGITLCGAHGEKWSLSRVLDSPVSFTACMTEYGNHAHWGRWRRLLAGSSASGHFGRMVWERPASTSRLLAAQMLPFKYLLDFKRRGASSASKQIWRDCVPQSESICPDRCAFTWPCARNEGTFSLHMEQNRCRIDLLFICFAGCEIASNLFVVVLHFGVSGIKLWQYALFAHRW